MASCRLPQRYAMLIVAAMVLGLLLPQPSHTIEHRHPAPQPAALQSRLATPTGRPLAPQPQRHPTAHTVRTDRPPQSPVPSDTAPPAPLAPHWPLPLLVAATAVLLSLLSAALAARRHRTSMIWAEAAAQEEEAPEDETEFEQIAKSWALSAKNGRPLSSSDSGYTQLVEVIEVPRGADGALPLGLEMQEFYANRGQGRGIVLISNILPGGAAEGTGLQPGDTIVAVGTSRSTPTTVEGCDMPRLLDALADLKGSPMSVLWIKRRVARASVRVVVYPRGSDTPVTMTVPAGRRLETALLDADLVDPSGREMSCGGDAVCGTCVVLIESGGDLLSPPSATEAPRITGGSRLSCQAILGAGNREGQVVVRLFE